MTVTFQSGDITRIRPRLTVVGVGGAGSNAVANMIEQHLQGVDFVICNTDAQSMEGSPCENRVRLGNNITQGLGAGSQPELGRAAAEEAVDEIIDVISGSNMVFIAAGMGGGTGTGAAPVIARLARDQGILTVGVVTKPFDFEGARRMRLAEQGIEDLEQYVDSLITIPNQHLFRIANEHTTLVEAFRMADEVLYAGVRGITDLIVTPGLVDLDFADIRTVMSEMGKAMMGTGEAEGPKRASEAAEAAINNPLLDDVSLNGAKAALINITGGADMTLFDVNEAAERVRQEVDPEASIIWGSALDKEMDGRVRVSMVATGITTQAKATGRSESGITVTPFINKVGANSTSQTASRVADAKSLQARTEALKRELAPLGKVDSERSKQENPASNTQVTDFRKYTTDSPDDSLVSALNHGEDSLAPLPETYPFDPLSSRQNPRDNLEADMSTKLKSQQERHDASSVSLSSFEENEDLLDIPAFLRRQAN